MNRWMCLLLVLAALAVGILIGRSRPDKMDMLITKQGKVFPSPKKGDVLHWVNQGNGDVPIKWDGPIEKLKSPCKDYGKADSATCKVEFKTSVPNFMYHYKCTGCGDPGVPGPRSGGGPIEVTAAAATGNLFSARVGLNGNVSGDYYLAPDDPSGFDAPIPVSTYLDPKRHDQITWESATDEAGNSVPWKVVMLDDTCDEQKNGGVIGSGGSSTCTVLASAKSQYYCVLYNNDQTPAGNAKLMVNGLQLPGVIPSPVCTWH